RRRAYGTTAHRHRVPTAALLHAPPRRSAVEDASRRACLRLRRRARQQRDRGLRAPPAPAARRAAHRDPARPGVRLRRRRRMKSLRSGLPLSLSRLLVVGVALLAVGFERFSRELGEQYVLSRLEHDADLLYARVHDAVDRERAAQDAAGTVYDLP